MARRQAKPLSEAAFAEQRKFTRTSVAWNGMLETGGNSYACTVLNLSANGARLRLDRAVTGHHWSGVLTIPSLGAFRAKVAWNTQVGAIELGLTFQDPPAAMALALAEALPKGRSAPVA